MYYVDLSWTVLLVLAGGEVRLHKKQTIPYSIFFASSMSTPRIYRCHAFSRDIKSPNQYTSTSVQMRKWQHVGKERCESQVNSNMKDSISEHND
jgi:hypothetical protein